MQLIMLLIILVYLYGKIAIEICTLIFIYVAEYAIISANTILHSSTILHFYAILSIVSVWLRIMADIILLAKTSMQSSASTIAVSTLAQNERSTGNSTTLGSRYFLGMGFHCGL